MGSFPYFKVKLLSIRQTVRLNTLFYSSLFFVMIGLSGVYLYNLQSERVEEKTQKALELGRSTLDLQAGLIHKHLEQLLLDVPLLEKWNPQKATAFFTQTCQDILAHNSVLFNIYFALEKKRAIQLFRRPGYIVAYHRILESTRKESAQTSEKYKTEIFTDPGYQNNPKEVWYHVAKLSPKVEFTEIYFDQTYMKRWMVTAGKGYFVNDKFEGMVGIDILMEDLVRKLEEIQLGSTGGLILVDSRTDQILTKMRGLPSEFIRLASDYQTPHFTPDRQKNWKELLASDGKVKTFIGDNGKSYIVAAKHLESLPWTAVVFQQTQEAYQPVFVQISVLLMVGILSLILLAILSSEFSDSINNPIDLLIQALTKNIESAKLGEVKEVEFGHRDHQEISQISKLVNKLVNVINIRLQRQHELVEEQRLKATQAARMAALGQMAGSVAHEINNPLTTISLQAELLQKELSEKFPDQAALNRIKSIRSVTERITKIISGLRALSRDGSQDSFTDQALSSVINATLQICQEKFLASGISLAVSEIPEIHLRCRGVQISQVLLNLLNNSFDAVINEANRWVKINFRVTEEEAEISIIDSGHGIPASYSERVMQPFFTTKDVNLGTGLGLSISKRIVEAHGGQLRYDPHYENTRFVITLPIATDLVNSKNTDKN